MNYSFDNLIKDEILVKTGIYSISNIVNGKKYLGSAAGKSGFYGRLARHRNTLLTGKHKNKHLLSAINKYGFKNFKISILEFCSPEDCLGLEQSWIDKVNPEYNLYLKAGSPLGYKFNEEQKLKISEIKKAFYKDPKNREKMRDLMIGRKLTEEWKNKISKSKQGKKLTQKQKDNIKAGMLKRKLRLKNEEVA